ncbi:hypothetical protein [Pseudomonas savastanoi]|uniref:hypothetical protein n=1 Tax=Pseudomonas savastanoi TaxID=29438 RepID=UPI0017841D4F|nr:hypothetical protein [Pseudomonas savastanoi]QOI07929.1 hypothetical protein D5S10_29845 [Pseudomonas savastanoi]
MKFPITALSLLAFVATASVHAADVSPKEAGAQLARVLSCQQGASPSEVIKLIKVAGGKSIVQASDLSDGEYTLPNPLDVFGRPVTKIGIHEQSNGEGDFNEYSGQFSGESIATVAKLADVPQDDVGEYRKEVGGHDLTLRAESGETYISCANDVRTVTKAVKRMAKEASTTVEKSFKSN